MTPPSLLFLLVYKTDYSEVGIIEITMITRGMSKATFQGGKCTVKSAEGIFFMRTFRDEMIDGEIESAFTRLDIAR